MRQTVRRLQMPPGGPGSILQQMGRSGGMPGSSMGMTGAMQGGAPFPPMSMMGGGPGGQVPPEVLEKLQQATGGMNLGDIVAQAQKMAMAQGGPGGDGGPKMGMYMMGQGVDERGKRVARMGKVIKDMKTGKVEKDFVEKQLDPDDVALPKEPVSEYATEDAIEVEVDATPVEAGANAAAAEAPPASGATETISEAEIVFERADKDSK